MSVFTLAEIEEQLTAYKAALIACAGGGSYRVNRGGVDKMWTSADLPEIRKTITWLNQEKQALLPMSQRPARRVYARNGGRG